MSDIELRELSFDNQTDITGILEYYRSNPSNSNKYRYELFGYIDRILESRERALLAAIRAELPPYINRVGRRDIYERDPDQKWYDAGQNDTLNKIEAILTKYEWEIQ